MNFILFPALGCRLWEGGKGTEGSEHITWACLVSWVNKTDGGIFCFRTLSARYGFGSRTEAEIGEECRNIKNRPVIFTLRKMEGNQWPGRVIAPGRTTKYLGHWSKKTQNVLKNRVVRPNHCKTLYSDEVAVRSHLNFICGHPVWRNLTLVSC